MGYMKNAMTNDNGNIITSRDNNMPTFHPTKETTVSTTKAISLNKLAGSNWSLGLITEVRPYHDRAIVKLSDGTFRTVVLKTVRAVRGLPDVTMMNIIADLNDRINVPTAFCAAAYNGRTWSANEYFVGCLSAKEFLVLSTESNNVSY